MDDLSYSAAAVVVWLPEGQEPKTSDFAIGDDRALAPPYPNPEAWWELGQAVVNARTVDRSGHSKVPWIKTGDRILSPNDVVQAYEKFKSKG